MQTNNALHQHDERRSPLETRLHHHSHHIR